MTMSRCFSTVFDEPMKAKGFKRKGVLYYRIHGDMIQGITMKTTNPYIISYNFHPWWMHDLCKDFWPTEMYIKKNVWAEAFDKTGYYFDASKEDEALDGMRDMLDWVENHVIPILDNVSSVEDYIQIFLENIEVKSPIPEIRIMWFSEYAFLYQAWKDQSFERIKRIFEEFLKRDREDYIRLNPHCDLEYIRDFYQKRYPIFRSKMEANDYSSFGELYEAECEKMRELLQTHLKLTV